MEHLSKLLLKPDNARQQLSLFGLVFEEFPTYTDIVNGTPNLTWVFEVSRISTAIESVLVRPPGFEPGTPEV